MAVTLDQILLDEKTALDVAEAVELNDQYDAVKVYIEWDAQATGGSVIVEEAYSTAYTGTWAEIYTVVFSVASAVDTVTVPAPFRAVRTRISAAITGTGGSVTSYIVAR